MKDIAVYILVVLIVFILSSIEISIAKIQKDINTITKCYTAERIKQ